MKGSFELRHWRSRAKTPPRPSPLHVHQLSPVNCIDNGGVELNYWKDGGYTSLRDLISSPTGSSILNSPLTPRTADIQIRNWLVKKAAYAYLQPTPSAREASSRRRCFSLRRAVAALGSCFGFIGQCFRKIQFGNGVSDKGGQVVLY